MEKSRPLSRQSSVTSLRRSSCIKHVLISPPCRLCMYVGIVFSAGILLGAYLGRYFPDRGGLLSGRPARGVVTEMEEGRPGLSIKKDLSIQFRDYIPRHVFIDVSTGPPNSLELFLETYPDAHKYTLYAFLADDTYKALYSQFPKLSLYPRTVPSTTQKSTTMVISTGQHSGANSSLSISTVDFSSWLMDKVHPDEFVIVKLTTDPKNEEQIVRQLVTTGAVEWIDKFYTTSSNTDVIEIAKERFSTRGYSVFLWDDEKYTYSDFDDVNPKTERQESIRISDCQVEAKPSTHFAMLLYFSTVNKYSSAALRLLGELSDKHTTKLPVTLFLTVDYLDSRSQCAELLSLGKQMELGLYLPDSSIAAVRSKDVEVLQNQIRNKLVYMEHCFADGNSTLDYILSKANLDAQHSQTKCSGKKDEGLVEYGRLVKEVISTRRYTIMGNVYEVAPVAGETRIDFMKVTEDSANGSLLAMDISTQGTDVILLQLLTSHRSSLFPLSKCVDMEIKRQQ